MTTTDKRPTRKVLAATAGAALGEITAWVLTSLLGLPDVPAPALSVVGAFTLGYLIREQ